MIDFAALGASNDPMFARVFSKLKGLSRSVAGDSAGTMRRVFLPGAIEAMQEAMWEAQVSRTPSFRTPRQALDYATRTVPMLMGDTLINARTNNRTPADPVRYTYPDTPVMFSPREATDLYAARGLPAEIIDKKGRAMVMDGVTFKFTQRKETVWDEDKVRALEDAADDTGLNYVLGDAITDSFLYGGSVLYPVFGSDTPASLMRDMEKMSLERDCVSGWKHVDRWNVTAVPSLVVTTKDYINPASVLIPQVSEEVSTTRVAMLRPAYIPYWAVLYNIGWCPSDFTGWLDAYYGYQTTMQSVPVMAQQMSLLLYKLPLDALNATIGPEAVRKLMEVNEEKMNEWSATNPKAVNMVGEVEVVDRTYSGFEQFIGSMKNNLSAQCGIPEPSLWHTPNKGFSDNTTESLLKASETMRLAKTAIERSMKPVRDALIAHVFGTSSKEWEGRHTLRLAFDKPLMATEKDQAEVGARLSAAVNSFVQAGIGPDVALKMASQFFPAIKVSQTLLDEVKASFDEGQEREERMAKEGAELRAKQMGGGTGPSKASAGNQSRIGHFGKA